MNEHLPRHTPVIKASTNRAFGFVFTAFFLIIALLPLMHGGKFRLWALVLSACVLFITLVLPSILTPANQLWTKFGELLHTIVSPIALGILFFFVITPIALLMKIFGKDPLRLKFDRAAKSYWITRTPPGPDPQSLNNQF